MFDIEKFLTQKNFNRNQAISTVQREFIYVYVWRTLDGIHCIFNRTHAVHTWEIDERVWFWIFFNANRMASIRLTEPFHICVSMMMRWLWVHHTTLNAIKWVSKFVSVQLFNSIECHCAWYDLIICASHGRHVSAINLLIHTFRLIHIQTTVPFIVAWVNAKFQRLIHFGYCMQWHNDARVRLPFPMCVCVCVWVGCVDTWIV